MKGNEGNESMSKYGRGQVPPSQREIQAGREFDSLLIGLNIGNHAQQSLQIFSIQFPTGHHRRREEGCRRDVGNLKIWGENFEGERRSW